MPLSKVIHRNYPCMNSVLDVVFTDIDTNIAEDIFPAIWQLAAKYERILSCHDPKAEVFQMNQSVIHDYFKVSPFLFQILRECRLYHQLTHGYFDIGLKKVKETPGMAKATGKTGMEAIEMNEENQTVRFLSEYTAVDLGGVGKGYLLRAIGELLTANSIENCFISFGGSSILTRGKHPHGSGWPVTLRTGGDPDYTFYLNNHAASISESHPGEKQISHIIHPLKLEPVTENRVSFVQSNDPVLSEVLSTALIIAPVEEAAVILTKANVDKGLVWEKLRDGGLKIIYPE